MMNDYKIKNILESLKEEVENGKVSLREAAVELHKAGWTNFIDIDATRNLLKTRNVTGNGNVPGVSDMMGKYREMKAAHPDALYIFRNGESCELYEDDAIAASGILGIATAERVDGQGKGVKELRFSFRDLDVYLPKLIRAGNRVAVCEPNQTGSGKRVSARTPYGNMKRTMNCLLKNGWRITGASWTRKSSRLRRSTMPTSPG